MIDRGKVVFITVDWMKYYQGITENDIPLGTGGSYPKEEKHEVFNFLDDDGTCYGYTPPYGRINLKEICNSEIRKSVDGNQYIEDVLIIFNASKNDGNKRRIIGFYVGATIFKEPYVNTNPKRIVIANNTFAKYNIKVKSENVYLFEEEQERKYFLPYSKKDGYGYGQSNIWYSNNPKDQKFKYEIIDLLENIINENASEIDAFDERKFYEGDIKTTIKNVNTIKRNSLARKKCLEHYFPENKRYKCVLCKFDFEEYYGELGKNYIEVHHIESHTELSKTKGEHEIDPINDLIPICSNCHSVIHRKKSPIPIEELKLIIKNRKIK